MSSRRYKAALAGIVAAGALARVAVILWIPTQPVSDFYGFFRVAQNLAAVGRYEAKPGLPDNGRSPAYPALLSLAFRAAPERELAAAKAVNVGLFVGAALAAAALARRLWGDAGGLWTAALLSFLPRPVLMTDLVASENLARRSSSASSSPPLRRGAGAHWPRPRRSAASPGSSVSRAPSFTPCRSSGSRAPSPLGASLERASKARRSAGSPSSFF